MEEVEEKIIQGQARPFDKREFTYLVLLRNRLTL